MKFTVAVFLSSCLLLGLSVVLTARPAALPEGGCVARDAAIYGVSASILHRNLTRRIEEIESGDTDSEKVFKNKERCLPRTSEKYFEYRLTPSDPDANRIVWLRAEDKFYFTMDHYKSFYQVIRNV